MPRTALSLDLQLDPEMLCCTSRPLHPQNTFARVEDWDALPLGAGRVPAALRSAMHTPALRPALREAAALRPPLPKRVRRALPTTAVLHRMREPPADGELLGNVASTPMCHCNSNLPEAQCGAMQRCSADAALRALSCHTPIQQPRLLITSNLRCERRWRTLSWPKVCRCERWGRTG